MRGGGYMVINPADSLVTPTDVRVNANHLKKVDDDTLKAVIEEMHVVFIQEALTRMQNNSLLVSKLKVVEKYLSQHTATLNVRRADSEGVAGMSKSISVPKDQDLDQTEYGQMARKIANDIPLDWASDDLPASVVIY